MPPWLDTPDEAGAILVAVLGVLATIGAGIVMSVAGVLIAAVKVWRSKVKPVLTSTQTAAETAADQLTPNHGSSARDSLNRIELTLDRVSRDLSRQVGEIRQDMTRHESVSERQHAELFRRVNHLESPMEDTRP